MKYKRYRNPDIARNKPRLVDHDRFVWLLITKREPGMLEGIPFPCEFYADNIFQYAIFGPQEFFGEEEGDREFYRQNRELFNINSDIANLILSYVGEGRLSPVTLRHIINCDVKNIHSIQSRKLEAIKLMSDDFEFAKEFPELFLASVDHESLNLRILLAIVEANVNHLKLINSRKSEIIRKLIDSPKISELALIYPEEVSSAFNSDSFFLERIFKKPEYVDWYSGPNKEKYLKQAVAINTLCLYHIENPSYEVCLEAVKIDWYALGAVPIKHLDQTICMEAYSQNILALRFLWTEVGLHDQGEWKRNPKTKWYEDQSSETYQKILSWDTARKLEIQISEAKGAMVENPVAVSKRRLSIL